MSEQDILAEIAAEAAAPKTTQDSLKLLIAVTEEHGDLKRHLANLEESMKTVVAQIEAIETQRIPDLMFKMNIATFALNDGSSVEVNDILKCSITKENREAALNWLRENDHGDLIKNVVSVDFSRGQDEEAARVVAALAALVPKDSIHQEENVHWQTLNAWYKNLHKQFMELEVGTVPMPPDGAFSIYEGVRAKITPPKKK